MDKVYLLFFPETFTSFTGEEKRKEKDFFFNLYTVKLKARCFNWNLFSNEQQNSVLRIETNFWL